MNKKYQNIIIKLFFILLQILFFGVSAYAYAAGPDADPVTDTAVIVSVAECCAKEAWPKAERVLKRELEMLGLKVVVTQGTQMNEERRRRELQEATQKHRAACAIRVVRPAGDPGRVDLWVEDRVTRKMLFRQLGGHRGETAWNAEIVALRAVEMLRASLMELRMENRSMKTPSPAVPKVIARLAQAPREIPPFRAAVSAGTWFSSGGVPPLAQLQIGLFHYLDNFHWGIAGSTSLFSEEIRKMGLRAGIQVGDLFLWGFWDPPSRISFVKSAIGVGFGTLMVHVQGTSNAENITNREDFTYVAAAAARFELRFLVNPWMHFSVSASAGMAFPEITIRFLDAVAATAGNPFAQLLAGIEVALF